MVRGKCKRGQSVSVVVTSWGFGTLPPFLVQAPQPPCKSGSPTTVKPGRALLDRSRPRPARRNTRGSGNGLRPPTLPTRCSLTELYLHLPGAQTKSPGPVCVEAAQPPHYRRRAHQGILSCEVSCNALPLGPAIVPR